MDELELRLEVQPVTILDLELTVLERMDDVCDDDVDVEVVVALDDIDISLAKKVRMRFCFCEERECLVRSCAGLIWLRDARCAHQILAAHKIDFSRWRR